MSELTKQDISKAITAIKKHTILMQQFCGILKDIPTTVPMSRMHELEKLKQQEKDVLDKILTCNNNIQAMILLLEDCNKE